MNESNILGKFIPEFQKIVCLMQFDMYHSYTVDEHTIFTISNNFKTISYNLNTISNNFQQFRTI